MPGPTLMSWGMTAFEVWPMNMEEWTSETATDWAPKEIAGGPTYLEWVGEEAERINVRGKVFPYTKIGGMSELEAMEARRMAGHSDTLVLGGANGQGGVVLGWYVIERLSREHERLGAAGVGQVVRFEAIFCRVPAPPGSAYLSGLYRLFTGQ